MLHPFSSPRVATLILIKSLCDHVQNRHPFSLSQKPLLSSLEALIRPIRPCHSPKYSPYAVPSQRRDTQLRWRSTTTSPTRRQALSSILKKSLRLARRMGTQNSNLCQHLDFCLAISGMHRLCVPSFRVVAENSSNQQRRLGPILGYHGCRMSSYILPPCCVSHLSSPPSRPLYRLAYRPLQAIFMQHKMNTHGLASRIF